MSITYQIDHGKRRILAIATGALGVRDLVAFQQEIGSDSTFSGYDAIFDASWVDSLLDLNIDNLKRLAVLAASSDVAGMPSKLVIVAPQEVYFGLGRMYGSFRTCVPGSCRVSATFRSRKEAERWLDVRNENELAAFSGMTAPVSLR